MSSSNVHVTGGSGMLGSHVVDRLLASGVEQVVTLDRTINRRDPSGALEIGRVTLIESDIRNEQAAHKALRDGM